MTFEFGPIANFIDITAQYSNAVLAVVMPFVADFAKEMELGPSNQFTSNSVREMFIDPRREDVAGSMVFANGFVIGFGHGHIRGFSSPGAYSKEGDPERVPLYFASVKIDAVEAMSLARSKLKSLGIALEAVFADLEPDIVLPERVGANVIPFYQIRWPDPRGGWAARVEINGNTKTVERLDLSSENLNRDPFKVSVTPRLRADHPITGLRLHGINPEYGFGLLPLVMREVTNLAARLSISLGPPLTTNHLKRFYVADNGGWPHAELELTNGMRFIYRNTNLVGYFGSDELWNSDKRKIRVAEFAGSWRMSDREIVELARQTLARLGYPKGFVHTDREPELQKPKGQFEKLIPRCKVEWMYPDSATMTQWSYVEIDADKREIKAIYFDDESFRRNKPPIDVPISEVARTVVPGR